MLEIGNKVNKKDLVYFSVTMEEYIKEIFWIIGDMGKVNRIMQTELNIKENLLLVKKRGKVYFCPVMVLFMMVSLKMIWFMVGDLLNGMMVKVIKVNGNLVKCMD